MSMCEHVPAPATMYMEVRGQRQESVLAFHLTEVGSLVDPAGAVGAPRLVAHEPLNDALASAPILL